MAATRPGPSKGIDSGAGITGFDCSGLVLYSFAGVGIKLPHYSGSQYNLGRKIPSAQMRRGDVIFYGPGGSQHVTIYLGDGQMLEAPDIGLKVRVAPVRTSGMTPLRDPLHRLLTRSYAPQAFSPDQPGLDHRCGDRADVVCGRPGHGRPRPVGPHVAGHDQRRGPRRSARRRQRSRCRPPRRPPRPRWTWASSFSAGSGSTSAAIPLRAGRQQHQRGKIPRANGRQAIEYVIQRAGSQMGVPYSWGGGSLDGPSKGVGDGANINGFDCSGLMRYAFAGVGVLIPRFSGDQYNAGRHIPPNEARRGDLIFYGPDGSQHVTMYLGNGQMLEASGLRRQSHRQPGA